MQQPTYLIIRNFADIVFVTSKPDTKRFPKQLDKKGVVIVRGGVTLNKGIKKKIKKTYDTVFQGRFHPQKGVLELTDIWKILVNKKPDAKLVMIGDGPLMKSVKLKVRSEKLEKNIILTGYLFDGEEKYRIFSKSKIVVHPAIFDSGGMASMEAMAFGLPCVGFNLSSYKYYYPKGMIKAKAGHLQEFADKILELISNKKIYERVKEEALDLVSHNHSWEYRSRQIISRMLE